MDIMIIANYNDKIFNIFWEVINSHKITCKCIFER